MARATQVARLRAGDLIAGTPAEFAGRDHRVPPDRVKASCDAPGSGPAVTPVRFFADLWHSACRPAVFRRCLVIAVVVGTTLTAINLGDVIWRGAVDLCVALKIVANFVVPFVVSNLGAMTSLPPSGSRR